VQRAVGVIVLGWSEGAWGWLGFGRHGSSTGLELPK
jgi:hypothetical protein